MESVDLDLSHEILDLVGLKEAISSFCFLFIILQASNQRRKIIGGKKASIFREVWEAKERK